MTLNDYRNWLDGFLAASGGALTSEQAEAMRAKLATVEAAPFDWGSVLPVHPPLPTDRTAPAWPNTWIVTCDNLGAPLGGEFEAVWDANVGSLYQS